MKTILFAVLFLLVGIYGANASEILGRISTDPGQLATTAPINLPVINVPADNSKPSGQGGGPVMFFQNQNIQTVQKPKEPELKKIAKTPDNYSPEKKPVKVLGAVFYPDGSLLKADGHRIYIIKKGARKLIPDLKALGKYQGRIIHKVTPAELAAYQDRPNLEGELIRQKGTAGVYVISQGKKKHILNLAELRAHYFGLEIFNISMEEMRLY